MTEKSQFGFRCYVTRSATQLESVPLFWYLKIDRCLSLQDQRFSKRLETEALQETGLMLENRAVLSTREGV